MAHRSKRRNEKFDDISSDSSSSEDDSMSSSSSTSEDGASSSKKNKKKKRSWRANPLEPAGDPMEIALKEKLLKRAERRSEKRSRRLETEEKKKRRKQRSPSPAPVKKKVKKRDYDHHTGVDKGKRNWGDTKRYSPPRKLNLDSNQFYRYEDELEPGEAPPGDYERSRSHSRGVSRDRDRGFSRDRDRRMSPGYRKRSPTPDYDRRRRGPDERYRRDGRRHSERDGDRRENRSRYEDRPERVICRGGYTEALRSVSKGSVPEPIFLNKKVMQHAEEIRRRKLLWKRGKQSETSTAKPTELSEFHVEMLPPSAIKGMGSADKYKKLMGLKGEEPGEVRRRDERHERIMDDLDAQYSVARQQTHQQRGYGLGFSSRYTELMNWNHKCRLGGRKGIGFGLPNRDEYRPVDEVPKETVPLYKPEPITSPEDLEPGEVGGGGGQRKESPVIGQPKGDSGVAVSWEGIRKRDEGDSDMSA